MVIKVLEKDIPAEVPLPELEPTGAVSLDDLIVRWEAARTGLRQALEQIPPETSRSPSAAIPWPVPWTPAKPSSSSPCTSTTTCAKSGVLRNRLREPGREP